MEAPFNGNSNISSLRRNEKLFTIGIRQDDMEIIQATYGRNIHEKSDWSQEITPIIEII
jgi:hypothetical protein